MREGGARFDLAEWFRRKDGAFVPVECTVTAQRDRGRVSGAIVVFRDVTERRLSAALMRDKQTALERANRQLAAHNAEVERIIEKRTAELHLLNQSLQMWGEQLLAKQGFVEGLLASLQSGLIYFNERMVVELCNPVAAAILGQPVERLIAVHVRELFARREDEEAALAVAASGERRTGTYCGPDGRIWDLGFDPVRDRQGDAIGVLVQFFDVTERAGLQRELAEHNSRQQRQIEAIREAEALKDDFLNSLSHELRAPLATILATVDLMDCQLDAAGAEEPRSSLLSLKRNAKTLLGLVSDMLDSSRIQAKELRVVPRLVEVGRLFDEVVFDLGHLVEAKRLELRREPGAAYVMADEQRLWQVLVNMVGNAIKFTPPGGTITLRALEGEWVRFEIADTGIGIAAADQPRLFGRFVQLGDERQRSGLGLGLSICKALVEAHGGSIGCTSAPGVGSTFWFTMPRGHLHGARPTGRLEA